MAVMGDICTLSDCGMPSLCDLKPQDLQCPLDIRGHCGSPRAWGKGLGQWREGWNGFAETSRVFVACT